MSKAAAIVAIFALLLSASLTQATRPEPGVHTENGVEVAKNDCGGLGAKECIIKKSLDAHVDYIYTGEDHHD